MESYRAGVLLGGQHHIHGQTLDEQYTTTNYFKIRFRKIVFAAIIAGYYDFELRKVSSALDLLFPGLYSLPPDSLGPLPESEVSEISKSCA